MSVIASRGNAGGKTELTTAVNATTANTGVVLVAVDITDILALVGVSPAEKKLRAFQRAAAELQRAIESLPYSDVQLDARVTEQQATVAALKAARPTGSL